MKAIADLEGLGCEVTRTGSQEICNPPPVGSDIDYLVWVPSSDLLGYVVNCLSGHGYNWEGDVHYQEVGKSSFMSWRNVEMNFIVTANEVFKKRHKAATAICKKLNVMDKADRVAIFQAFLYGNVVEEAVS